MEGKEIVRLPTITTTRFMICRGMVKKEGFAVTDTLRLFILFLILTKKVNIMVQGLITLITRWAKQEGVY